MRVKLVHGMNSITCANNVLPTFMPRPREYHPRKATQKSDFKVQIGTKQNWLESRASIGFHPNQYPFNRTLLKRHLPGYTKGDGTIMPQLLQHTERAIQNSRWLLKQQAAAGTDNPSTKIHEVVRYLEELAEEG